MKTTRTKIATVGATIGIVAALLAVTGVLTPVLAATQHAADPTSATSAASSAVPGLTVGQAITLTSAQGHYKVVGESSENGTASGNVTLTVAGKFAGGYSLSLTSGNLIVNGTDYSVTSGTAQTGPFAHRMVGQGTTSTVGTTGNATAGAFLMSATARGSFAGEYVTVSFDLQSGTTEYAIFLVGTIQG